MSMTFDTVRTCALTMAGAAMMALGPACAVAQDADQKPAESYATLFLTNLTGVSQGNDVVTDLRNMLPRAKIYRVESANAISVQGVLKISPRRRRFWRISIGRRRAIG